MPRRFQKFLTNLYLIPNVYNDAVVMAIFFIIPPVLDGNAWWELQIPSS